MFAALDEFDEATLRFFDSINHGPRHSGGEDEPAGNWTVDHAPLSSKWTERVWRAYGTVSLLSLVLGTTFATVLAIAMVVNARSAQVVIAALLGR